jgi:membrane associated rhomboid family serine protease
MIKSSIDKNFYFSTSVILLPMLFVMGMWLCFYAGLHYFPEMHEFGILPKTLKGLRGVPLHVFIHGDFKHLLNNSIPIFFLVMALKYFYRQQFWKVLFLGILFSGIGTWLIGRNSYHIGASSLVYCLVSFVFFKGILSKYYRLVALSLTIVLLYGGIIWYMFPNAETLKGNVSWEGHFAGFVTGLTMGIFIKTPQFEKPIFYDWEHPDFDPSDKPFFKQFDEHGNFINPPKPEPEVIEETEVDSYFKSSVKVIYEFLKLK